MTAPVRNQSMNRTESGTRAGIKPRRGRRTAPIRKLETPATPVARSSTSSSTTLAYRQSAGRLTGTVTLYHRNPATFGEDIRKLNTKRHTIMQALASPEYTLMEKQRIKTFSRDVFGQLRALPW